MDNKSILNARRSIPVRQVVKRSFSRVPLRHNGRKGLDAITSLKALSNLQKSLIGAEQAARMAAQDLDDSRYTDAESIQAAYRDAPKIMKALKCIDNAMQCIKQANDHIDSAKATLRTGQDGEAQAGMNVGASSVQPDEGLPAMTSVRRRKKVMW